MRVCLIKSSRKLSHGLVEWDVFEYFDPGQEGTTARDAVKEVAPERDDCEVYKLARGEGNIRDGRLHVEVDDGSEKKQDCGMKCLQVRTLTCVPELGST